ncbi:potassium/proton antiporter [Planococcus sp. N028]|uniref:Potassium/proton antiporter n=1 Tax=Planococcus shixiaomingii TaxID=3058393 RepID=A0ABT8N6Q7_9BACL|nr:MULTISPECIES: potassium/proton antiporter [unclassified Planococcus (in: firmicutes)]MDN7243337.1 potassium/proton antiporter [Planococcus sp. N028]WKA55279.1 potassium/proton antiporter [Planococcus sp. N022]
MIEFSTNGIILIGGIFLLAGVLMTKVSARAGVPSLVLFMIIGMFLGSDISGIIYFSNADIAQLVGVVALIFILFEGGLQASWKHIRPVLGGSLALATIGVVITTTIVAIAAYYILDINWIEAFLLGSIVGSTDAAAVFSVLAGQNIKSKISSTLEAESGTNDPMAMFLTIAFIHLIEAPDLSVGEMVGSFILEMGLGAIIGLGLGFFAVWAINHSNLDASGLYAVLSAGFAIFIYSFAATLHGSGLLAVYLAALVMGTRELTHSYSIVSFHEGVAWLMQILMFVMLGLLVFPSQLAEWDLIWRGLVLSLVLLLVARPIAVFVSTMFFNYSVKEKIFLSWAGLRGAVPIVLATFPLLAGVDNSFLFFNIVFFIVLTSALFQGSTIPYMAKKLSLNGRPQARRIHSLELVSMDRANAEMLEIELTAKSPFAGQLVQTIGLPKQTVISAIIRSGKLVMPTGKTKLKVGDVLYVLTEKKQVSKVKMVLGEEDIAN